MKKKAKVFKKPRNLKMSKRKEKVLDKTVIRWEKIKDNHKAFTTISCECCNAYSECTNCPVHLKSKEDCRGTPYSKYINNCRNVSETKRKRLAQDEIDFLQTCYY